MLVSVDAGNGYIKARTQEVSLCYPAVLSALSGRLSGFRFLGDQPEFLFGWNGQLYAVGRAALQVGAVPYSVRHPDRVEHDYYLLHLLAAFSISIPHSDSVSLILSLPPLYYAQRDRMRERFSGTYHIEALQGEDWVTKTLRIASLRIIPEGLGAVCFSLLSETGQIKADSQLHHQRVGVVDIGTYSTDFIMLDRLTLVSQACDTIPQALNSLHQRIRDVAAEHGLMLSDVEADLVLQQGFFRQRGRRVSIVPHVNRALEELTDSIYYRILTLWNGGNDIDRLIITGGGALHLAEPLSTRLPALVTMTWTDDVPPWFENCEGAFRYLRFLEGVSG